MRWATRMVCGYCSREQAMAERCQHCDKKLAGRAGGWGQRGGARSAAQHVRWGSFARQLCGKLDCASAAGSGAALRARAGVPHAGLRQAGLFFSHNTAPCPLFPLPPAAAPSGRNTRFWEGGEGCRDARFMTRKDPRKYKGRGGKTQSRKALRVGERGAGRRDARAAAAARQ